MKNIEVIQAFVNGDENAKTKNLYIEGDRLMNYDTCLAERFELLDGTLRFIVNISKYSTTTTTIQNKLINYLPEDPMNQFLTNIPMGADSLSVN